MNGNGLFRKQREQDLEAEISAHLAIETQQRIERGESPEMAAANARRDFGNLGLVQEVTREVWTSRWLQELAQDARYAFRMLSKNPGFSIAAIATLALGIGATTAIFAVMNTVLLKPAPYPDSDRVVTFLIGNDPPVSFARPIHFNTYREQTDVFQDVTAYRFGVMNLTGGAYPEQIPFGQVSAGFFRLFGVPLLEGRSFSEDEDLPGGRLVTVISYDLWQRRFGKDPQILGKTITLRGNLHEVIGVLGPDFSTLEFEPSPDVLIPFRIDPNDIATRLFLRVAGRLKPAATLSTANMHLEAAAKDFAVRHPRVPGDHFSVAPFKDVRVREIRFALWILAGAVGFVLLIACANVANLLLVRTAARRREITIRTSLGAGRGRIIRQLLTESLLLSSIGGAAGLGIGLLGMRAMLAMNPGNPDTGFFLDSSVAIPRVGPGGSLVMMDWRVVLFTSSVALAAGILCGLLPALQSSGAAVNRTIRRGGNKTRSFLVVLEMSVALVLLTGAALLIRTFVELRSVDPGFDPGNVVTMRMSLDGPQYSQTAAVHQLVQQGLERLRAVPGIVAASTACCLPLEDGYAFSFQIRGRPAEVTKDVITTWTPISPGYFDAFRIPLILGRVFTETDIAGAPDVVIISKSLADRFWPGADPLGSEITFDLEGKPRRIVGVVDGDVAGQGLNHDPLPATYAPEGQTGDSLNAMVISQTPLTWAIRTTSDPSAWSPTLARELEQATGFAPGRIRTMDEVLAQSISRQTFNMRLLSIFGGVALLLASIGIYGLIAYSVQQRFHEIGVRLALGAQPSTVWRMVIFQGMSVAMIGVFVGILAAGGLTRFLESFLFGVEAHDLTVFTIVPVVLSTVALIAVWIPARRATRIDPAVALRHD